jgi:hypothetical protein
VSSTFVSAPRASGEPWSGLRSRKMMPFGLATTQKAASIMSAHLWAISSYARKQICLRLWLSYSTHSWHLGGEAECRGCTDDIEKAYWRVPNSQPEFSVVVQMDLDRPEGPRVVLLRIPGHSFGLVSAVTNVNSLAEFTTHCSRWIGRAACGRYYDDLFIIDPRRGRDSAKEALHWMQGKLGIPLTREVAKCIPMGPSVVFIGLVTLFEHFAQRPPWAGCEGGSH